MFPTCSEVLEVLTRLGYRKVAAATDPACFDEPLQSATVEPSDLL
jgi:hypothetical protein